MLSKTMSHLTALLILFAVYSPAAAEDQPPAASGGAPGASGGPSRNLDGDIDRPCSLICLNGGSCQLSTDAEVHQLGRPSQYCACPEGYGGITCEYVAEKCGFIETGEEAVNLLPDGKRPKTKYCLHGAPCKRTVDAATGKEHHFCDCGLAIEAGAYAGEQCESPATSYCRGGKVQRASFCVNGGTCRGGEGGPDKHAPCDCPTAFEGEYCEYLLGLSPSTVFEDTIKPSSEVENNVVGAIMCALLGGVVLGLIATVIWGARLKTVEDRIDAASAAMNGATDLALDPNGEKLILSEAAAGNVGKVVDGSKMYKPMDSQSSEREEII